MNILEHWQALVDSSAMAIVMAACIVQYATNLDKHSTHCERWGFVLTGAGAFGVAVYNWTSIIEPFNFELMTHIGMALIAVSLLYDRVRGFLAKRPGMRWAERRERT